MNIGLYGGSFDPVHIGHIHAAKTFCKECALDILYVVPAKVSPFKTNNKKHVTDNDRLNMTKLAFDNLSKGISTNIIVSDIEIARQGTSYTIDTLCNLKDMHKDDNIFMLVGSDMFITLGKWKNFNDIFSMCTIFTLSRDKDGQKNIREYSNLFKDKYNAKIIISDAKEVVASSSDIRKELSKNNNEYNLLTKEVENYIKENNLYV